MNITVNTLCYAIFLALFIVSVLAFSKRENKGKYIFFVVICFILLIFFRKLTRVFRNRRKERLRKLLNP